MSECWQPDNIEIKEEWNAEEITVNGEGTDVHDSQKPSVHEVNKDLSTIYLLTFIKAEP